MDLCANCKIKKVTGVCPYCRRSFYCSKECFAEVWSKHDKGPHSSLGLSNVDVSGRTGGSNSKGIEIEFKQTLHVGNMSINSLLLPKNKIVFSGDDKLIVFEIQKDQIILNPVLIIKVPGEVLSFLSLTHHPNDLIIGGTFGRIWVYENYLKNNQPILFPGLKRPINSFLQLPNSKFASLSVMGELAIWDYKTKKRIFLFNNFGFRFESLYFYKMKLIIGDYIKGIHIWNLSSLKDPIKIISKQLIKLPSSINSFNSVYHSTKSHFYTGLTSGNIIEFSVTSNKIIRKLVGHTESVTRLILSKTQNYLFSASSDTTIRVWNLITNKQIKILKRHSSRIESLLLTPYNLLISSSNDGIVHTHLVNEPLEPHIEDEVEYIERIDFINKILIEKQEEQEEEEEGEDEDLNSIEIKFKNKTFTIPAYFFGRTKGEKIETKVDSHLREVQIYFILVGYPVYYTSPTQYFEMYLIFFYMKMWGYCYDISKQLENDTDNLDTLVKLFNMDINHFEDLFYKKDEETLLETKKLPVGIFSLTIFNIFKRRETEMVHHDDTLEYTSSFIYSKLGTLKEKELRNLPLIRKMSTAISVFQPWTKSRRRERVRIRMRSLLTSKTGSNLILKSAIDGVEFKVHKELLIFKTNFFYLMFSFGGVESQEKKITIQFFNSIQLKLLLNFIYVDEFSFKEYSKLSTILREDLLKKLFTHAKMYFETRMIQYIKKTGLDFLKKI